jgi:uncharacterized lipoprotein
MMLRVVLGAAFACALAACNEPTRTTEGKEGAYGASSGPNANDPDADVAAQDRDPTYDEPQTGTGSEFGEPTDPTNADDQSRQSNPN